MKYNILIHAINGIGLWHINRTVLLAKELIKNDSIWNIIFISNSKNPFLIKEEWFTFIELDYWIEDTLTKIAHSEFEKNNYLKLNEVINNYKIDIVLHDTFFIKKIIDFRCDLKHFLILRDCEFDYLNTIKNYFPKFKKIYIPHIENEFSSKKIEFYNNYNNIFFINYIFEELHFDFTKEKKIIISPWYWGDLENTLHFFKYVNNLLKNISKIDDYQIFFILWKHYDFIKKELSFIEKSNQIDFYPNFKKQLKDCKLFIWRWWYNTLNEVINNNCNSLLFEVERFGENQNSRINYFNKQFNLETILKWDYNEKEDLKKILFLLNSDFNNWSIFEKNIFNWISNFSKDFLNEIKKENILVFKNIFLPKSENFIHEELTKIKQINPIIFTLRKEKNAFVNNLEIIYFKKFDDLLDNNYPLIKDKKLYLNFLKYLKYLIKKYNIKIIYTEFLFDAYFISQIKQIVWDIKIISAWRWYDVYNFLQNKNIKPLNFLEKLDKILPRDINMSDNILKYWINKDKIEIVRSVLNFNKYKFIKKDFSKINVLIWWRFVEKKWILNLLNLINLLKKWKIIWKIWLVWDWELKHKILSKIDNLWLDNSIINYWFLDHKNLIETIKDYNCYINYSEVSKSWDNEWINNFIIENMLSWSIIFTTLTWWIWEIIIDGKTWVVLSGKSENDFLKIEKIYKTLNVESIIKNWLKIVQKELWESNWIIKLEKILTDFSNK